ncbi:carboxypeptidase S [Atractiella rhizophila]|nr:carboxypeptidase S [Atractiella rhizophila]
MSYRPVAITSDDDASDNESVASSSSSNSSIKTSSTTSSITFRLPLPVTSNATFPPLISSAFKSSDNESFGERIRNIFQSSILSFSIIISVGFIALLIWLLPYLNLPPLPWAGLLPLGRYHNIPDDFSIPSCAQPPPLVPDARYRISPDRDRTSKLLSDAIKIPTESWDDEGEVGEDPRWEVFLPFHEWLEGAFPNVYKSEKVEKEKVNEYGLLYVWKGSNESLKPLLLMAHQDTVPVDPSTSSLWTHPPFSGDIDSAWIWGRGAVDCKSQLVSVLETVESLLIAGFKPKRTVIVSFGFDEETTGYKGAGKLHDRIVEKFGKDSVVAIVDEGGLVEEQWGRTFAYPHIGEKGYMDLEITVETPGGHSSTPPRHTSIGIMSSLITALEASPFFPDLQPTNPFVNELICTAEYGLTLPLDGKRAIENMRDGDFDTVLEWLDVEEGEWAEERRWLAATSQAVDIIQGGVKVNSLPERVTATVNYRLNPSHTLSQVKQRITTVLYPAVAYHGLAFHPFVNDNTTSFDYHFQMPHIRKPRGTVTLRGIGELESAPVSPTEGKVWETFSATIRGWKDDIVVAPSAPSGNTDTHFMWDLTPNIYRFSPVDKDGARGLHTVDERINRDELVGMVKFFGNLILNFDALDNN